MSDELKLSTVEEWETFTGHLSFKRPREEWTPQMREMIDKLDASLHPKEESE